MKLKNILDGKRMENRRSFEGRFGFDAEFIKAIRLSLS